MKRNRSEDPEARASLERAAAAVAALSQTLSLSGFERSAPGYAALAGLVDACRKTLPRSEAVERSLEGIAMQARAARRLLEPMVDALVALEKSASRSRTRTRLTTPRSSAKSKRR